jgi:hypothetical protein
MSDLLKTHLYIIFTFLRVHRMAQLQTIIALIVLAQTVHAQDSQMDESTGPPLPIASPRIAKLTNSTMRQNNSNVVISTISSSSSLSSSSSTRVYVPVTQSPKTQKKRNNFLDKEDAKVQVSKESILLS